MKEARAFGDLSENFEYKAAKKEKNRNDSRCRYLENMIKTAVVIEEKSAAGTVGLYDKVTLYVEEDGVSRYAQVEPAADIAGVQYVYVIVDYGESQRSRPVMRPIGA